MEVCGCVVSFSTRVIYILANKGERRREKEWRLYTTRRIVE